jgi:hypothetical protein
MLSPKLSRTSWLTNLLLMFALLAAPLVGVTAQTIKRDTERQASPDLNALSQYGVLLGDNISLTSIPLLSGDNTASMAIVKE